MRVLLPNYAIDNTSRITPIIEKRFEVNGKTKRSLYVAKEMSDDVNGIALEKQGELTACSSNYVICNLKKETVKEIIQLALKNGYVDLSGYGIKEITSEVELNNTGSTPYITRTFLSVTSMVTYDDEIKVSLLSPLPPLDMYIKSFEEEANESEDVIDEE